jgi:hypothetical protein
VIEEAFATGRYEEAAHRRGQALAASAELDDLAAAVAACGQLGDGDAAGHVGMDLPGWGSPTLGPR